MTPEAIRQPDATLDRPPSRRELVAAALLSPAASVFAAPAPSHPRVLAGLMPGVNEPGSALARRAIALLSPAAAGAVNWMPWARAFMTASGEDSLIFPLARTPDREKSWQWLAPLAQDRVVLVVSRDAAHRGTAPEGLNTLKTGAIRSAFIVGRLHALGFGAIDVAPTETANARKLALGRIEAWATVASVATALSQRGDLPAGSRIVPLGPGSFTMWLAASGAVDASALVDSGRIAQLWDKPLPAASGAQG